MINISWHECVLDFHLEEPRLKLIYDDYAI